jgi:arsenite oxidase small subunit
VALSRREFLLTGTAAGAVAGAAVLVPLGFVLSDDDAPPEGATGAALATYPRTRIGSLSDLAVGEAQFFDYPYDGTTNVLVRLGERASGGIGPDRDVVAYSNRCTHMGCPVTEYQSELHLLGPCPCHFSSFDLSRDGIASLGQATQNLPRVLLELEDDDIYATGVYRLMYGFDDNLAGENLVVVGEGV